MCSQRTENMDLVFRQGLRDEVLAFEIACVDMKKNEGKLVIL